MDRGSVLATGEGVHSVAPSAAPPSPTSASPSRTCSRRPLGSLLYSTALSALPLSLALLFCFFPSVSSDIFLSWSCVSYQNEPGSSVEYLRIDPSLKCDTAAHNELTNVAWVFVVVWPVCVPLLFLSLLLSLRKHIVFHQFTPLVHATAFLHSEYRSGCFWWEPLELMRKLVLTGLVTHIPESTAARSTCPWGSQQPM